MNFQLTKEQETLLRETINEANERKEKRDAEAAISKLKEYRLGKIPNFACDFVLPEFDRKINTLLIHYYEKREYIDVRKVIDLIPQTNGFFVYWS